MGGQWCKSWSESKPKNQEHQSLKAEDGCLSWSRENSLLLYLFALFWPSTDWMIPTHTGDNDLYSAYWLNAHLFQRQLTDIPRNNALPAIWTSSTLSSWHTQLTITGLQANLGARYPDHHVLTGAICVDSNSNSAPWSGLYLLLL